MESAPLAGPGLHPHSRFCSFPGPSSLGTSGSRAEATLHQQREEGEGGGSAPPPRQAFLEVLAVHLKGTAFSFRCILQGLAVAASR